MPGWSVRERAVLDQMRLVIGRTAPELDWDEGTTDRGEPWLVAVDRSTDDLALHVTRIGREYVVLDADLAPIVSGRSLRTVAETCTDLCRSGVLTAEEPERLAQRGLQTAHLQVFGPEGMPMLPEDPNLGPADETIASRFAGLEDAHDLPEASRTIGRPVEEPTTREPAAPSHALGLSDGSGDSDRQATTERAELPQPPSITTLRDTGPAEPQMPLDLNLHDIVQFAELRARIPTEPRMEGENVLADTGGTNVIPFPMTRAAPEAMPEPSEPPGGMMNDMPVDPTRAMPERDTPEGNDPDAWTRLLDDFRGGSQQAEASALYGDALLFSDVLEIGDVPEALDLGSTDLLGPATETAPLSDDGADGEPDDIALIGSRGSVETEDTPFLGPDADSFLLF